MRDDLRDPSAGGCTSDLPPVTPPSVAGGGGHVDYGLHRHSKAEQLRARSEVDGAVGAYCGLALCASVDHVVREHGARGAIYRIELAALPAIVDGAIRLYVRGSRAATSHEGEGGGRAEGGARLEGSHVHSRAGEGIYLLTYLLACLLTCLLTD